MPPPKRPKLAPISMEQFLSDDEIQQLDEVDEIDEDDVTGQVDINQHRHSQHHGHADHTNKGPLNLTTTNRRSSRRPNNRLRDLFLEDIDNPMTVSSWTLDHHTRNSEDSPCSSCILLQNRDRLIYNQAHTHTHSDVSISHSHSAHSHENEHLNGSYQSYAADEPSDLSLKDPKRDSPGQRETPVASVKRSVTPTGGLFDFGEVYVPIKQEKLEVEEVVNLFQFPVTEPTTKTSNFPEHPVEQPPVVQERPLLGPMHPGKSIFSGGLPSTFTKSVSRAKYYHDQDRTTTTTSELATPRISASKFKQYQTSKVQTKTDVGSDPVRENQLRILAATLTNRKKL